MMPQHEHDKSQATEAPDLSNDAWRFLRSHALKTDGEFTTFSGDWGNWNYLLGQMWNLSKAESRMPDSKTTNWRPIATAPKDRRIALLIPYDRSKVTEVECTDEGRWCADAECFRFDGDDGPRDIQPTHWREPATNG